MKSVNTIRILVGSGMLAPSLAIMSMKRGNTKAVMTMIATANAIMTMIG